jgi:adenylyl-sulfate kinase
MKPGRENFGTAASGRDSAPHSDAAVTGNIARHAHAVSESARALRFGHGGAVVWLTGLSGSGKTTLAMALEKALFDQGRAVYVLDGDNLRNGLNADLGFSPEDRSENIRRVGEVAALFADAGLICIVALISPYRADRARARAAVKRGRFIEVHLAADLATCEARDPRGLYRLARAGKLDNFTGVDAPYEVPEQPEITLATGIRSVADCIAQFQRHIALHNI